MTDVEDDMNRLIDHYTNDHWDVVLNNAKTGMYDAVLAQLCNAQKKGPDGTALHALQQKISTWFQQQGSSESRGTWFMVAIASLIVFTAMFIW